MSTTARRLYLVDASLGLFAHSHEEAEEIIESLFDSNEAMHGGAWTTVETDEYESVDAVETP